MTFSLRDLNSLELVTDNRQRRSVTIECKPSVLARQFIRSTCGSVSGDESGYFSDTGSRLTNSNFPSSSISSGPGVEEDGEDIEEVFPASPPSEVKKSTPTRMMTIHPFPSPCPSRFPKPHRTLPPYLRNLPPSSTFCSFPIEAQLKKDAKVLRQVVTSYELGSPTSPQPSYQQDDMSAMLPRHGYLEVPTTMLRSISPTLLLWNHKKKQKKEEKKKKTVTQNLRITALKSTGRGNPSERTSSLSYHLMGLDPEIMISSPVHRPTDSSPVTLRDQPLLRRVNALKRTSVLDIVDMNRLSYDVSNQTHKLLMP